MVSALGKMFMRFQEATLLNASLRQFLPTPGDENVHRDPSTPRPCCYAPTIAAARTPAPPANVRLHAVLLAVIVTPARAVDVSARESTGDKKVQQ